MNAPHSNHADVTADPSDVDAQRLEPWDDEGIDREPLFDTHGMVATFTSMLVHLLLILGLALVSLPVPSEEAVVLQSDVPEYEEDKVEVIEDFTYSEIPQDVVGALSTDESSMAEASAEMFAETAEISNPIELVPTDLGQIMVNKMFAQSVAPQERLKDVKGKVGEGTTGAAGAVDRITFEILKTLEEGPTLVVWLFDRSGSLHRQRQEIRQRFDRVYDELGIAQQSGKNVFGKNDQDAPLLTSLIGFGSDVTLYTQDAIADLDEIKSIVDNIEIDDSGEERVFSAIFSAAERYKNLRRRRGGNEPQRRVLFVVVTDERGDDAQQLERTIDSCRRWGIPVYVIGVPAPFGREHSLVKYVDPDPKFDQTPQWAQVDQGPETFMPERVQVGFTGNFEQEPAIDSGFGPYALTRLCYETGGIYFTVHPNRRTNRQVGRGEIQPFASDLKYFFDPEAMARYRPDYLAPQDYLRSVKSSPLRQALVDAASQPPAEGIASPRLRFVRREEAQLVGELTKAQQEAAKLEPTLVRLEQTLEPGMRIREQESNLRWRAGYDLALGRVLAQKVRTETYNAMLAQAKRGMRFENEKNNTWILNASEKITVGSKWEREANLAKQLLSEVVRDHEGTPWALLANQELKVPIGWEWKEDYTNIDPPRRMTTPGNGNNVMRPAQDEQKRMLNKAPKRPVPKL